MLNCTELQWTSPHCSNAMNITYFTVLHCTSLHRTALHRTSRHNTALHCTAVHCTALHCTALHYTALHYTALHCTALDLSSVQCTWAAYYVHETLRWRQPPEKGDGTDWSSTANWSSSNLYSMMQPILYPTSSTPNKTVSFYIGHKA